MNQLFRIFESDGVGETNASLPTPVELHNLAARQGYRCALSGVELQPEHAVLDHVVPVSDGGTDDVSNLQWVDARINEAKGVMSSAEFIALCEQVTSHCHAKRAARWAI